MPLLAITDGYVLIGGNNISDHVSSMEFEVEADDLDATVFGTAGYRSTLGGLKSGTLNLTIKGDYAASQVDALLWPMFGTVQTFEVRPTSAARSTTNPAYTGSVLINGLTPITGSVGDLVEFDVSWPTTGTVTRATS